MSIIYKIISDEYEGVYVGSTTNTLKYRWCSHNHFYKDLTETRLLYTHIRENGGIENWRIELIEECDKSIRKEREQYYIDTIANLNMSDAVFNPEKKREYDKAHYEAKKEYYAEYHKKDRKENPEKYSGWSKAYYEANKEKIAVYGKGHKEKNKEEIRKKDAEYREKNRERIREKNSRRVNCDICGKELSYSYLTKHKKIHQ